MKKFFLFFALILGVGLNVQAQIENINQSSGTIYVGCSGYTNSVNRTWNVNIGQNKKVTVFYSICTELGYDFVEIKSVDTNGATQQLIKTSGTETGTISSAFSSGKIQIIFTTDGSLSCASGSSQYTGFYLYFCAEDDITMYSGPTAFAGKVGIGTASPEGSLEVHQSVRPTIVLRSAVSRLQVGIADVPGDYCPWSQKGDVTFRTLGSYNRMNFNIPNNSNNGNSYIKFGDNANGAWVGIFNNRIMRIDGKVIAKEITIQTNVFADHVFSPDYKLPSLENVSNHIKEYRHLPDIPTEAEVKESGINIGEMQVKLLQKIEELTLYLINQEKTIQELREEIQQLKETR